MIKTDVSKKMGELLLKGWPMLAESCPCCQIPLMRDPKTRSMLCLNCDKMYAEGSSLQESANDGACDLKECDDDDGSGGDEDVISQKELKDVSSDKGPAPWRQSPQSNDQAADLLSQKLLQGWALLEQCCPKCSTPLVRNKQKRMMCVICNLWVMTEEQAAQATAAAAVAADTVQITEATNPSENLVGKKKTLGISSPSAAQISFATANGSGGDPGHNGLQTSFNPMRNADYGCKSVPGTHSDFMTKLSPTPELLSLLAAALNEKLWQAQALIVATPVIDATTVRNCVAVVSECLEALGKVRNEAQQQQTTTAANESTNSRSL